MNESLSQSAVLTVWWGSAAVFFVVMLVVVVLLTLIRNTARQIDHGAAAIWVQGKLVANHTIQIPLLLPLTVKAISKIREVAGQIAGATEMIQLHAQECPGCPECALGSRGSHRAESPPIDAAFRSEV